jgi:(1->4)-alpha-D-glucan 1-alpha-D-glucosylmutase
MGDSYLNDAFARAVADSPALKNTVRAIAALFARRDGAPLVMDALRRFSQLSAPVAAKAVEDTAFYRYGRLLSRNDVGFDPRRQVMSVAEFHRRMAARASSLPLAMLATATHDHKRGEDARARIAALSHRPQAWEEFVASAPAAAGIDPADAYHLYQTLLGAWPGEGAAGEFIERIQGWCRKYLREAKLRSSWTAPSEDYEARFCAFASDLVLREEAAPFRGGLSALLVRLRPVANANSLLQLVVRLSAPGVPDLYQGCEFEDLSLVDPDNRRPVDFSARAKALAEGTEVKQTMIARVLAVRRDDPELWARGDYHPLPADAHVLAFSRSHGQSRLIVVALCRLEESAGSLALDRSYRELLTGKDFPAGRTMLRDLLGARTAAVLYARRHG